MLLSIFYPKKNQKKKREKKFKILEDIHEENLEDCPSWR